MPHPRKRKTWKKGELRSGHDRVTERIIEQLEQGTVPWHSPHTATVGFPRNFQSGKDYRGINVMLLGMAGYVSPWFMTYKQTQERGGQVRRGEKGYFVIKYGTYTKEDQDGQEEERGYLKAYTVFNASQIDGVEFPEIERALSVDGGCLTSAQAIVDGMPNPPVIHEGRSVRTCYYPKDDSIDIPHRAHFESEKRFYKSLYHELTHASGAAKRLARKTLLENKGQVMGSLATYSKEELVAELGAAFLCAHAGIVIDDHENSAAYLDGWLKVLKQGSNRRWIVEAAGQAQKAVDYILNVEL